MSNVHDFQNFFENIFNTTDVFTINIGELTKVDVNGVAVFEDLYKQAMLNKKRVYLTGYGSRDLYDHLRTLKWQEEPYFVY